MTDRCKRCNLPQVDYPLYVDDKGYPIEPKESIQRLFKGDFKNIKWVNLIKMKLRDILFIAIVLIMAWSYAHDTEQYREAFGESCTFTEKVAYSGMCNVSIDKVMVGNSIYQDRMNLLRDIQTPPLNQNGNWNIS